MSKRIEQRFRTAKLKQSEVQRKHPVIGLKHRLFARKAHPNLNARIRVAFHQGKRGVWRGYEINFETGECIPYPSFTNESDAHRWVYNGIPDFVVPEEEEII